jgi:hypothetical protein
MKELCVYGEDIKSIEGIQYFKSLVSLNFTDTSVNDLSPLAELKDLEMLTISSKSKIDFAPLSFLKKLELLYIYDMPITDLLCFSDLKNLKSLSLSQTLIEDFSPVPSLSNLYGLFIVTDHQIDDKSLGKWENLKLLVVSWESMSFDRIPVGKDFSKVAPFDVSQISNLIKLETITIEYPKLVNYESLSNLENLKWLKLSSMDKLNLAFISELPGLQIIELSNPGISDLKPLASLENLEIIKIGRNNLENISPLFDMKNLKDVSIALKSDCGDVIKEQLKNLQKQNIKAKRQFPGNQNSLTVLALGSSQLAFRDKNPDKNFGTWDELMKSKYIKEGWTRETIMDGYSLVIFEVIPSEKNEAGEIVKNSTFKIVAVPSDPSSELDIYAIDETWELKVWIGDDSIWDINNIDLSNENLWVSADF